MVRCSLDQRYASIPQRIRPTDQESAALRIPIFLIYAAFDGQTGTEHLLPKTERNITEAKRRSAETRM